jgi:2-polyprenyl-6-methoxyphenol hydroxylase-like FAD-dependent oxidoreductase
MTTIKVPVLIVGAGPVGLGLSLDLGGRGIDCLVIDHLPDLVGGIKINPRAAAVTPRTMEFCRRWGVADQVRNAGFPDDYELNNLYCTSLDGWLVALNRFPSMRDRVPHPVSPETRQRCPQIWFDPILAKGMSQLPGVRLQLHWKLESFEDLGDRVVAKIRDLDHDEIQIVECQFMIACDGSASTVRTQLGIGTDGAGNLGLALNAVVDIPDFMGSHDKGQAERYYFVDGTGVWAVLTVIDARERWRFGLMGTRGDAEVTPADLDASIRRALGPNVKYTLIAMAPWQRRESIAKEFRRGRVFLAGDAAHAMAPDLGLGMNTGAAGAFDLGWKLEATIKGWGGRRLLDSYEAERKPAARRNAEASTHTFRHLGATGDDAHLVTEPGPRGDAARKSMGERLMSSLRVGWDTIGLAMGYYYEHSPICIADGTPPPVERGFGHYVQSSRPGGRAPHAWLKDGRSTIDLFGNGYTLMRSAERDVSGLVAAAAARGVPMTVFDIAEAPIRELYEAGLVLVRPDGHVAWRSNDVPADPMHIIDTVRGA